VIKQERNDEKREKNAENKVMTNRDLRDAAAIPEAELQLEDLAREDVPFLEAENLSPENALARVKLPIPC